MDGEGQSVVTMRDRVKGPKGNAMIRNKKEEKRIKISVEIQWTSDEESKNKN